VSQMCVVTVCQDPCVRDGFWNQIPRPIDSSIGVASVMGLRERIESANFGRRLGQFVIVVVFISVPHISSLVSPCLFRMAGKTVDEYDACWLAEHIADIELTETHSTDGLRGSKRTVNPAGGITPSWCTSDDPFMIIDSDEVIEGLYARPALIW
jgi:hypothetical protein